MVNRIKKGDLVVVTVHHGYPAIIAWGFAEESASGPCDLIEVLRPDKTCAWTVEQREVHHKSQNVLKDRSCVTKKAQSRANARGYFWELSLKPSLPC